jgi:hypothetical protein
VGSNSAVGMDVCVLMSVLCCQTEVSVSDHSSSPTECCAFECEYEALIFKGPLSTKGCCAMGKIILINYISIL